MKLKKKKVNKSATLDNLKNKIVNKWNALDKYEKIFSVILVVLLLACVVAFLAGKIIAGIISLIQIALCVTAILIKKEIIKSSKRHLKIILPVVAVALAIPFFAAFGTNDRVKNLDWADVVLCDVLPETESKRAEILVNSDEDLSMYVYKISKVQYKDYVVACIDKGFTIEKKETGNSYFAYNQDGYKLQLSYDEDEKRLHISVDAPIQLSELKWSNSYIAKMLPAPKSSVGRIEKDDEHGFVAYIGELPLDDFNEYVNLCITNGFEVESQRTENSYKAKNGEGYFLTVEYKGNKLVSISVTEPEYDIGIEVECIKNLVFSTYDVEIYVNDVSIGRIKNGMTEFFNTVLKKGVYTIKFVSAENKEIFGETKVKISKNETYKFKISCNSESIEIETLLGTIDVEIKSISFSDKTEIKLYDFSSPVNKSFKVETTEEISNICDMLDFVSENPDIATITCDSNNSNYLSVIITPKKAGETFVYIKDKESKTVSQKIKVVVETFDETKTDYEPNTDYQTETEEETEYRGKEVYVTPYGKKYHYSSSCAGENASAIPESDAEGLYGPCKKCVG